jgi:hypothetical protein
MSVVSWAALIWFGAPVAFVSGAIAALITQWSSGFGPQLAVLCAAVAPWLLLATPLAAGSTSWVFVLLTAWSAGCVVTLAADRWRDA